MNPNTVIHKNSWYKLYVHIIQAHKMGTNSVIISVSLKHHATTGGGVPNANPFKDLLN